MKKRLILACVTLLLATVGPALGQTHAFIWDATNGMRDLGSLGGDSFATAVNDSGTVVGFYDPADGSYFHGFIWTEATGMVDIGIPGGGNGRFASCQPTAINNAGNVVGYGREADGFQVAFFWSPSGGFTTLGDLTCSCDNGNVAYAINDNDEVTGNLKVKNVGDIYHAFLWSPALNGPRDLGTVAGAQYSVGYGINNLRQIVGGSLSTSDFTWQPMVWSRPEGMRLLRNLADATYIQTAGINDAGGIIGYGYTSTETFSFYKGPGIGWTFLQGLGGNETYAQAINQQGVIVGWSSPTTGGEDAAIWSNPTSAPQDLGPGAARGLNNVGQVVGESYFP